MSRISQSPGGKKNPLQIVLVKRLHGWDVAFGVGGGWGESRVMEQIRQMRHPDVSKTGSSYHP